MSILRILTFTFISFTSLTVFATEQSPDLLIYKSDTIFIETYPLGKLIKSDSLIRKRILEYSDEVCLSSGCWRGYVATWKIENDSLFLVGLINGCEDHKFNLKDVFRDMNAEGEKVFAQWFTGELLEYKSWSDLIGDEISEKKHDRLRFKITNGNFTKDQKNINDCKNAISKAKLDFLNSKYSLHSLELFPVENTYFYVLDKYYNIQWYFTDSIEYYNCYDSIMTANLKNKYGFDFLERARSISDSLKRTKNWISNAEFIGGEREIMNFILSRLTIDRLDLNNGISSRLYIEIEIDSTGQVINPIIRRGIGERTDKQVIEIINEMPNWKPAYLYGKPINQKYYIPLNINYE